MNIDEVKRIIVALINNLLEEEPHSRDDLLRWREKAERVKSLMAYDDGRLDVPHILWHYLDDADIRLKDHEYANEQLPHVQEVIRDWQQMKPELGAKGEAKGSGGN